MPSFKPSNKGRHQDVCGFFFKLNDKANSPNEYKCTVCGTQRKRFGSSWENLMSHIRESHKNYIELMKFQKDNSQGSLYRYVDSKTKNIWGWMKFIVKRGVPFSWCEDKIVREFSKLDPISVETLMKYMHLLTQEVENLIRETLPKQFGLIIDGWSEGSEHFFAIFACFPVNDKCKTLLLAFAPPIQEGIFLLFIH
jgi:hypothetical protein